MEKDKKTNEIEDVAETQVVSKDPSFSREQLNEACFAARTQEAKKSAKKIAELEAQVKTLQTRPILEKALVEGGCKQKAIGHIIAGHPELMEIAQNTDALKQEIKKLAEEFDYAFEQKPFNADPLASKQVDEKAQKENELNRLSTFFNK